MLGVYSEVALQKRQAEGTVHTKHQLDLDSRGNRENPRCTTVRRGKEAEEEEEEEEEEEGLIFQQKHASVCKLKRRSPNAVARRRPKPEVDGTTP